MLECEVPNAASGDSHSNDIHLHATAVSLLSQHVESSGIISVCVPFSYRVYLLDTYSSDGPQ